MRTLFRPACLAILLPTIAAAATVQFVVITPDTGPDAPERIHLASALDGWDPAGRTVPRVAPGLYTATFELPPATTLEYKFTRTGSWETVEKGPGGHEVANRRLVVRAEDADRVIVVRIARWADRAAAAPRQLECDGASATAATTRPASTRTGAVRTHDVVAPQLGGERRVLVWLPPGYDEHPDERYPVVYFHDGNNGRYAVNLLMRYDPIFRNPVVGGQPIRTAYTANPADPLYAHPGNILPPIPRLPVCPNPIFAGDIRP